MKAEAHHLASLAENLAALLVQENSACQDLIASLVETARTIQGDTRDLRLQRLAAQLKALRERLDLLTQMAAADFLAKIKAEAEALKNSRVDSRLTGILTALMEIHLPALNHFCETLLDHLIAATGAERGFVLFYLPETTEAEVVAGRNFHTTNLSLEEYDFSRTLLQDVLAHGKPLLLENVSQHETYGREVSVRKFQIKSVLAAPLQHDHRTVGALYLENNSRPGVFSEEDLQFLETIAGFTIFYLRFARLLPVFLAQDRRIFFDASKAIKEIVGQAPPILALQEIIQRIADSPATVLISGETGTGKELVAAALHHQSARRDHPFVAINCAAIPENLLESQLFGHEKGAFTGANDRYVGRIEQAGGGTVFLDEISELPYAMQAKLLRFLQSSEFDRVGGKETIRVDVRVVAATKKSYGRFFVADKSA